MKKCSILDSICVEQCFSLRRGVCPPGNVWQGLEAFLVVTTGGWGRVLLAIRERVEARDADNFPMMNLKALTTRNHPAQNV